MFMHKGSGIILIMNLFEYKIAALVNQARIAEGLPPLILDDRLFEAARLKSGDMRDRNYCGHQSPVYGSPFDMLGNLGIDYRRAGENVAMGYHTPEKVMKGWMESPGHRSNIIGADYEKTGVGVVKDSSGTVYWTQLFIC